MYASFALSACCCRSTSSLHAARHPLFDRWPGASPGTGRCCRATAVLTSPQDPVPEPRQTQSGLRGVLLSYDAALKARPVITKALTSFVGFLIGDLIAQRFTGAGAFDIFRCARLSLYGLLIDGPVGHLWYRLLDRHVYPEAPTSNPAVLAKTAADQLVWAPAMTLVFFAFLKLLEGRLDLLIPTVKAKMWPMMVANYMVWPLAHFLNFKFVPSEYRILYNNVVSVAWTAYLSWTCGGPTEAQCSAAGMGMPSAAAKQ